MVFFSVSIALLIVMAQAAVDESFSSNHKSSTTSSSSHNNKNNKNNKQECNNNQLQMIQDSSQLLKLATKNGITVYGAFIDTSFLSLPLLIYKNVFSNQLSTNTMKQSANKLLSNNKWNDNGWSWSSGASSTPHFHDNCHETLVVLNGWAKLGWGKTGNIQATAYKGDVIFQPAGLFHSGKGCSNDCYTMGIYPDNSAMWRFEYNGPSKQQIKKINKLHGYDNGWPNDPVFGDKDSLKQFVDLMVEMQNKEKDSKI